MCDLYLRDELRGIQGFPDPQKHTIFATKTLGHLAEMGQPLRIESGLRPDARVHDARAKENI